jgi:RNA polymerase sigma factor (sigma-70 family)
MPRSWSDRELLEGIASQDEESLRAFDDQVRSRLLSLARRWRLNPEDAEDAVQETLIAAVRQIQSGAFEGAAPLGAWIIGIFDKRCADVRRRNARRGRWIADSQQSANIEQLPSTADWRTIAPDVSLRVREILHTLSPRERVVLLLNRQHGLKAREIAPLLRLGVKTTEAILTRARKRFCELVLGGEESNPPKRLR